MSRSDDIFACSGVVWCRRWAVAPGEHQNAGRYVWEAQLRHGGRELTVWCESRRFVVNGRGEKILVATYRIAVDRRQADGTWPLLMAAMDAAVAAAAKTTRAA